MKSKLIFTVLLVFSAIFMMSFMAPQDKKIGGPWEIPASFKNKKNPHADDASLLTTWPSRIWQTLQVMPW
jgi:hypothetical protein